MRDGARGARLVACLVGVALAASAGASPRGRADEPTDYDDAREEAKGFWLRIARPHHERWHKLVDDATSALRREDPDEAVTLLEEAVRLDPDAPLGHFLLASAREQKRDFAGCAEALLALERLDPEFVPPAPAPPGHREFLSGLCYSIAGHVERAIPFYLRLLARGAPTHEQGQLLWNLGDCYHVLGRLDEAIDAYARGSVARPHDPMLHLALGVALDRDEQVGRAREAIRQGLRLDPALLRAAEPSVIFLPPEDAWYYYGLAHRVAADDGDASRRLLALVHFRSYVAASPADGPWVRRARAHLAELGPAGVRATDVGLRGAATPAQAEAARRVLARVAVRLEECVAGRPGVAVRVTFHERRATPAAAAGKAAPATRRGAAAGGRSSPAGRGASSPAPRSAQPRISLASAGPESADPSVLGCVMERLRGVRLPSQVLRAHFHVVAR